MGYADEKALTSQYLSGFDGIRFRRQLYGVPTEVSNYACYANNPIWKSAGLDPMRDFPKTWEEMPAVAEKLHPARQQRRAAPPRLRFRLARPRRLWLTLNSLMHQRGANLVDEEAYKAPRRTSRPARDAVHWWTG